MKNKFSERLYFLRDQANLTQEQLAKRLGVKRYNISDWEKGRSAPDFDMLLKIAIFFNETTDYLLGKDDFSI